MDCVEAVAVGLYSEFGNSEFGSDAVGGVCNCFIHYSRSHKFSPFPNPIISHQLQPQNWSTQHKLNQTFKEMLSLKKLTTQTQNYIPYARHNDILRLSLNTSLASY